MRAIWDAMNDYGFVSVGGYAGVMTNEMKSYRQHGLLSRKLGDLGHELVPLLWWEYAVEPCRSLIQHTADRALKAAGNAADCFCHGRASDGGADVECCLGKGSFRATGVLSSQKRGSGLEKIKGRG